MGILAPVLLTVFGAALDYTLIYNKSSKLQAAALSAARELGITGTKDGEIKNITKDYVYKNFTMSGIDEADKNDLEIKTPRTSLGWSTPPLIPSNLEMILTVMANATQKMIDRVF